MKVIKRILPLIGIYFVAFVLLAFAISKFLNTQFQIFNFTLYRPLKDLSSYSLAWAFYGHSYVYNLFIGITEFVAAVFILFKRTRLAGLLLAAGIYLNVVLVDIEFGVHDALVHASIEFVIVLVLLIPYLKDLKKFFWDMSGKFIHRDETGENKIITLGIPAAFVVIVSVSMIVLLSSMKTEEDQIRGAYKIDNLIIKGDSIALEQGEFTKEPMLFFEFSNTYILSIYGNTYYGTYSLSGKNISITMDHKMKLFNKINGSLSINKNEIKGTTEKGEDIELKFSKVIVKQ